MNKFSDKTKSKMSKLMSTWTTQTLKAARKEYWCRMSDYNESEKKSWTYTNLKEQVELIGAELYKR